ncbi:MAG: metal-dependent hydrolase [Micavibrio sp.]|nr:metal-dependent hydrolase [Micavibrio sp.]
MATVFSHPAVPVALALALGQKTIPRPLLIAGIISSVLPDADCFGFILRIKYESQFGHRGFTHSIVFALLVALLWTWRNKELLAARKTVFFYTFIAGLSHPLLDALTNGGLGVALLWPFSTERFFFPVQPIPVSPIGKRFFSEDGFSVFISELSLIWLPCLALGGAGFLSRTFAKKP